MLCAACVASLSLAGAHGQCDDLLATHLVRPPQESHGHAQLWHSFKKQVLTDNQRRRPSNPRYDYRDELADFFRKCYETNRPVRVVEIGTCWAATPYHLLQKLPFVSSWYAVDPLLSGYDLLDASSVIFSRLARELNATARELSDAHAKAIASRMDELYGCRFHLLHRTSARAAPLFEDGSVDLIFVDGLHTYEGVRDDLHAWLPKLNPQTGILVANDYGREGKFPGVTRAVDEFFRGLGRRVVGSFKRPPGGTNGYVVLGNTSRCQSQEERYGRPFASNIKSKSKRQGDAAAAPVA